MATEEVIQSITWEAPEHAHIEKTTDWFWVVGLLTIASAAAAFIFGNILFGLVIIFGAVALVTHALRDPHTIPFAITARGVRIDGDLYPYATLAGYALDVENRHGPQLLLRNRKTFAPLLILPIPEEYIDEIEDVISLRLPEEELEEPLSHQILEFFGF
ncbi:hypothetical protein KTR10_01040 [Candidatus Kaiserbacteria bacterium]|nr:hypothetical protein [Candidatus Kaiserbacteria bacterium]